jgi:hypothetical protein
MTLYSPLPAPLGHWDDALLAPLAEINEQMLDQLKAMAADSAVAGDSVAPRLVQTLREQWCRLDAKAKVRLSMCPYLLLDLKFSQTESWQRLLSARVMDALPRGPCYFEGRAGVALIRRTLVLAWHLARSNRMMASVTMGLNPVVADRIAASRLKDLEAIAELCPAWVAPRWDQQVAVWRQMLRAAHSEQPLQLRQAQLRGVQLLAREHTRA